MKQKYRICMMMALLLTAFLLAMNGVRRRDEALAARIAPEVLRFHVLANSDSSEDQALKLAVKDFLLEEIQAEFIAGTSGFSEHSEESDEESAHRRTKWEQSAEPISSYYNKDMMEQFILDNRSTLESRAEEFIRTLSFDYPVEIRLEACEFPQKTYGDMTFPAGTYEAVRVLIGEGAGENFWCVLYPSLCYLDSTYAVVPDASKDALKALLPEDDFLALLSARHNKTEQDSLLPRITFRFKFAERFCN